MEPIHYLRILRRRWAVVLLSLQLATVVAWLTTPREPEPVIYSATHLLVQDALPEREGNTIGLDVLALLIATGPIPTAAAERLDVGLEPAELASKVIATGDPETGILSLTAEDEDPALAALLANTLAEETVRYVRAEAEEARQAALEGAERLRRSQEERIRDLSLEVARRLQEIAAVATPANLTVALGADAQYQVTLTERDALQGEYSATLRRIEQLSGAEAATGGLYTLQEAIPIPTPQGIGPPTSLAARIAIGAVMGLALGLALAYRLDRVDSRLRTRGSVEHAFGLPVVAEVPRLASRALSDHAVIVRSDPRSQTAEAYTALRLSLQLMPRWVLAPQPPGSSHPPSPSELATASRETKGTPPSVVLVTSASTGEGKTSTVANLAASFAEIGTRVLVLDCDFRNPGAHRYLGALPHPGVADFLLRDSEETSLSTLAQQTDISGVWIVPSGRQLARLGQILRTDQTLIREASEIADIVIIDAGSMLGVNDPAALIPHADAVVVVARSGYTTAESAGLTRELLGRLEAPVLGVVLVGVAGAHGAAPGRQYGNPGHGTHTAHMAAPAPAPLNGHDA